MKFDKVEMNARFWELQDARDAIEKKSAPIHAKVDALMIKMAPMEIERRKLNKEIQAIERPVMGEIDNEMVMIARATNNKPGPRPSAKAAEAA